MIYPLVQPSWTPVSRATTMTTFPSPRRASLSSTDDTAETLSPNEEDHTCAPLLPDDEDHTCAPLLPIAEPPYQTAANDEPLPLPLHDGWKAVHFFLTWGACGCYHVGRVVYLQWSDDRGAWHRPLTNTRAGCIGTIWLSVVLGYFFVDLCLGVLHWSEIYQMADGEEKKIHNRTWSVVAAFAFGLAVFFLLNIPGTATAP